MKERIAIDVYTSGGIDLFALYPSSDAALECLEVFQTYPWYHGFEIRDAV